MTIFNATIRPATAAEVAGAGWTIDGGKAQSPITGAWYCVADLRVHTHRTADDGAREVGRFLSLDATGPLVERYCVRIPGDE